MAMALVLCCALPLAARADELVTSIVFDPLTGVAMDGYDPVSYFTEAQPLMGSPDHEYRWGNVSWYFATAANRDVFSRNPDVYAPQFGGHCEMSLARGYLSDGKPEFYALVDVKLYLFYSAANREAFLLSPDEARSKAEANWAQLGPAAFGQAAAVWLGPAVTEGEAGHEAAVLAEAEHATAEGEAAHADEGHAEGDSHEAEPAAEHP